MSASLHTASFERASSNRPWIGSMGLQWINFSILSVLLKHYILLSVNLLFQPRPCHWLAEKSGLCQESALSIGIWSSPHISRNIPLTWELCRRHVIDHVVCLIRILLLNSFGYLTYPRYMWHVAGSSFAPNEARHSSLPGQSPDPFVIFPDQALWTIWTEE